MDLKQRVYQVKDLDLKNWILEIVSTAAHDMGAVLDATSKKHLCRRVYESMTSGDRKQWHLKEYSTLLDNGVKSHYEKKPTKSFTPVIWYAWLEEYTKSRARRFARVGLQEQQEKRNETSTPLVNSETAHSRTFFTAFRLRTAYGISRNDTMPFKELVKIYEREGENGLREYYKGLVSTHNALAV